jgi:ATP-dependent exoDNAse (exonuclease V) alpha subunit
LAIYHLTAGVISRARGQSAVAAAAYRCGARLRDERYGTVHDYTGKRSVSHAQIMAPEGTPDWVHDRELLWNRVEAAELRRDAQLARTIEVGLPVELGADQRVALVRDYIALVFVSRGMVADFSLLNDNPRNPSAHILLTLRGLSSTGFGPKERRWNGKSALLEWRSAWAGRANEHLARGGHLVRIDHRTLEAQQIELAPARRIGSWGSRREDAGLPEHLTDRIAEQRRIANDNGRLMLEDPTVALRALTHRSPTFTQHDLVRFLQSHTDGQAQFDAVSLAIQQSEELVALQPVDGEARFTSRDMIEAEKSLLHRATAMATRRGHAATPQSRAAALSQFVLDGEQRRLFDYLVAEGDAKALAIAMHPAALAIAAACHAWRLEGVTVSDIDWQDIAGRESAWQQGRELPVRASVLIIAGSEMLALKQLERALAMVDKARAKAVLVGDPARLQALPLDTPFRTVLRKVGLPGFMG